MNKEEEVFDLLEAKAFQELSDEEQLTVLKVMTQEEYELQRRIIVEAGNTEKMVAGPLVLPQKRSIVPVWFASLGSAAAAAILMFFIMQPDQVVKTDALKVSTKVIRDTLIVENTLRDTVIDYQIVRVSESASKNVEASPVQIPETISGAPVVPPIREEELVNSGVPAVNDATIAAFKVQPFIGM